MKNHVDDILDKPDGHPEVLIRYLNWARAPAHGRDRPAQKLFANLKHNIDRGERFTGRHGPAGPVMEPVPLAKGQRVRVVMASRFGDVGITPDLAAENGYVARCDVLETLENFGDEP